MQARRNLLVLERQDRLDQAGHAGGGVEVPDVALERSDRAKSPPLGALAKRSAESRNLDRVAHTSSGAVRFHVRNRIRIHLGGRQSRGHDFGLAGDARSQVSGLSQAVIINRRAPNHRMDAVAIGEGVLQPPQHHHAGPTAENGARRVGVEGPAVAVPGQDFSFPVQVAGPMRNFYGHSSRQRHVAFMPEQAPAGDMYGHQGSRAGRLNRHARPGQIQLIGDSRGQYVFVVPGLLQEEQARAAHQLRIRQEVEHEIRVHPGARVHSDGARKPIGVPAGVLQGLPHAFEKNAMLRIHDGRIPRAEAEKRCVEPVEIFQDGRCFDVGGVSQS